MAGIPGSPGSELPLLLVAVCDVAIAAIALLIPWQRLPVNAPALLGLPGFVALGLATWTFGGFAAGTGPFLVLLYAWLGLHFPRWVLMAFALPATAAYLVPLVLTHQPPMVLGSAVIIMPVALAVAVLIQAQEGHLREERERLLRIEQWRSAMINTLAHDVRSPLSNVWMALETLKEHVAGRHERMLDSALRQTARISRLAEGLLDVHRIDHSGHLELDLEMLSARELLQDALTYVRPDADVRVEVEDGLLVCVDRQRFEQIVINFVNNALRYGKPPVIVRMARDGEQDRLEVRDHGPGIPESLRPTLFQQFAVGGSEGVGLGLWITSRLAAAHGGQVSAEARDPGVAMVVTFPAPGGEGH